MPLRGPLAYPFGKPNSRFEINTPALVLDLDALERNIACMAKTMRAYGRNLRPHAKSHKCSRIGKMQIDAGALGVCCATLDEAEVMAAAGLPGIAITSPITARSKHPRLMEVLAQAPDTLIVVDNSENVDVLSQAATSAGLTLSILIDLDLGFGRTGVSTMEALHSVAERVLTAKNRGASSRTLFRFSSAASLLLSWNSPIRACELVCGSRRIPCGSDPTAAQDRVRRHGENE